VNNLWTVVRISFLAKILILYKVKYQVKPQEIIFPKATVDWVNEIRIKYIVT